ncbi:MAG: response regulator [Candidatus Aminicenantes bacterium]|nr:response regulator [Candidatus Aminicenantes bacterium]NIM79646.1 response regulator [Candidatus Aminicenantes bacterium]NIN18972.1 response regulator [Candidatus Aminicenantes bacterium]NIN42874.1 response regulator [Candidatus Aminicenantes bacterium]NIN85611.1 response regulator [Candidatus Aminicenantes bacterium]
MIIRTLLFLLVFFIGFIAMSPTVFSLDPKKEITQYVHDVWGLEDGLPQTSVQAVLQTRDGYLWLGTFEGLVRFDGINFKVFDKGNVEQLLNNHISVLYEDRKYNLWIGTNGGLICLKDGKFSSYTTRDGMSNDIVNVIYEDQEGNLWIGTDGGGLNLLKAGSTKFIAYTSKHGLSDNVVWSVYEDRKGNLWVGTNRGLNRLNAGKFTTYTTKEGLSNDMIWSIYEDRKGNLWVGTNRGLNLLNFKEGKINTYVIKKGLSNDHIRTFCEDRDGNLWIGTGGGGVKRLHLHDQELEDENYTIHAYTTEQGLSDNTIFSLYEDREGSLWIGTQTGGLNRLGDGKFTVYTTKQGLSHDVVWSIYEEGEGNLWIGTRGWLNRLIYKKDGKFNITGYPTGEGLFNKTVLSTCKDQEGSLWIGTEGDGLHRWKDGKLDTYTTKEGLSDNIIRILYVDKQENVWIGTRNGLNRLDRHEKEGKLTFTFTVYTTENGLSNNVIRILYADKQGNLWIGTNRGLNRLGQKDGKFNTYGTKEGLFDEMVNSIYEDQDGSMWIGTYGGGLNRLKDGKFTRVTIKEGLFDDTVHWILEYNRDNFWMSCNKGIFQVSKNDLNDFCDGKRDKVECISYDENDGMKSRECNGYGYPPGCKTRDGKLWFPTMKGVVMIDPSHLIRNNLPPPVKIEKIKVDDNKEFQPPFAINGNPLVLSPGIEQLEIHYTGLSFPAPKKVRFKYKLQGFDNEWRDVDTRRTAYYTKIPPGNYTFRVKACNNDGVWNEKGASVSFYLKPYFSQTFWFYLLCGLAVVLMGFTVYRIRFRQLRKREQALEYMVEERTDQLQKANIELETLLEDLKNTTEILMREREAAESANKAKSEFLANMSHEIRTPMNAILGFSEILEKEITGEQQKKHLEAISSSGKTLLDLINDILDLSRIEAGKMELHYEPVNPRSILNEIKHIFSHKVREKALDFQLQADPALPEALLLDSLRLRQILFNLVGNAVKFTDSGFIKLAAQKVAPGPPAKIPGPDKTGSCVNVVFSVQDTGQGIPGDQLQSIFDAFTQQPGQHAKKFGGTGLGLTITRRLVEMMGGVISVQSEIGKGSTFQVNLENVAVSRVVVEPEMDIKLDVEHIRFEKASILVADDNELNRQLLIEYFAHSPIDFLEAENGKEAVDLAKQYRPHLVLLDMKMPVVDGCEACRILKADEELKKIPVIIITASALKEERAKIEKAGCDAFLNKPVSKSDLIIELMHFLPYTAPESTEPTEMEGKEPENRAKLPELLNILQSDDITKRREMLSKALILDEIEDFVEEMKELAQRYHSVILSQWVNRLNNDLQAFDLAKIQETLASFPGLIKELTVLSVGKE